MKIKLFAVLAALSLLIPVQGAFADDATVQKELRDLVAKIQTKLKAGKKTEADLKDELKEFDALVAKHKDEKTEAVAQVLSMQASLYKQVLDNDAKGDELLAKLVKEFPDTKVAAAVKTQSEAMKVQASLVVGSKFPEFDEKDINGKAMSVAGYKGKVVLVDFWATWCGPCVAELPNVLEAYGKHHPEGFEIVGISLDQDKTKLTTFTAEHKMGWQQFFDGKGWQNKLAEKYGVNSIPATYLLNGEGVIIGKNLRGDALEAAVTKALAKK